MEIKYFNREKQQLEVEKVYGDGAIRWLYGSALGRACSSLLCAAPVSRLYGKWQNTSASKKKIKPFIENFSINIDEYLPQEGREESNPYSNFNQFFIRRFKPGRRHFLTSKEVMPAFCEGRYFGYESIRPEETIPVKGNFLSPKELIANEKWAETFQDGPLLLARLCPVDYHRFHYPDDGNVLDYYRVPGPLHSVNPLALKQKQDILITNERQVTILETAHMGKLAYIEVGAICVGKIVQTSALQAFKRGDEKGYFLFGGSTVIVVGEKGKWKPNEDVLEYTKKGIEVYIKLGECLADIKN